ncbi:MAG: hypothetical protein LCH95_11550 [Proteobacteria bacterium]|nr:hypothetical protein [Pseudomonadota bacterium]
MTGINAGPLADVSDGTLHVTLSAAPPTTLHGEFLWRTDGNSPLAIRDGVATVFFSGYEPRGHTLRRVGGRDLRFEAPPLPVMIVDDPDPASGKWIEAAWRAPGGPLIAWCHVEAPAPGGHLVLPRIDWMTSLDDGLVWRWRGTLVRLPPEKANLAWRNGFFAGGFGDLCLVPDRAGRWLYLFHSSYHPDEAAQGVAVLRLSADRPDGVPELWTGAGWCRDPGPPPRPLWPVRRGFRHPDPDSFWGPAVHYNRPLGAWVMLLNRTARGNANFCQEGIYASLNRDIADPSGWSPPLRIVAGGAWYPQAIGMDDGCGDTEVGDSSRFFMAGFSAWQIRFETARPGDDRARPLACTPADFARLFGADRRCPW